MAEATVEQRLSAASSFLLQSPPGEINDVLNDVRPLVGDDAALETGLLPAFERYNLEQLTVVELPGSKTPAIICPSAQLPSSSSSSQPRFYHPSTSQTFSFDHLHLSASDVRFYEPKTDEVEGLRKELEGEVERYVGNHYEGGAWGVWTVGEKPKEVVVREEQAPAVTEPEPQAEAEPMAISTPAPEEPVEGEPVTTDDVPKAETEATAAPTEVDAAVDEDKAEVAEPAVTSEAEAPQEDVPVAAPAVQEEEAPEPRSKHYQIHFVGNKYNPSNYWTGRWRSSYEVDLEAGTIKGQILVNVHYYEQGNVQLSTSFVPSLTLPSGPSSTSPQILKLISQTESAYQSDLNSAYSTLGDKAFRQLRRALPMTKSKIDWGRALGGYKMSSEIGK